MSHKFLYLFTDLLKCRDQGFTQTCYLFLLTLKRWQVTGLFLCFLIPLQISTQIFSYVCFNESKLILLRCFIESCDCFHRARLVILVCLDLKEIRYNNLIFSKMC